MIRLNKHTRWTITLALVAATSWTAAAQDELAVHSRPDGKNEVVVSVAQDLGVIATPLQVTGGTPWNLRVVHVPESKAVLATWTVSEGGTDTPWYSQSVDNGVSWLDARPTDYDLRLRYARFDPLKSTPWVSPSLSASSSQRLWIVQYIAPGLPQMRELVAAAGATPVAFLANHADIVNVPPTSLAAVKALPFVRWVGPYHPAYRLFPEDRIALEAGALADGLAWNIVAAREHDLAMKLGIASELSKFGATEFLPVVRETSLLTLSLPRPAVWAAIQHDDVLWLDRWSAPELDMDIARQFTGAVAVSTVGPGGYRGQGVNGEVLDGGCDTSHPDLAGVTWHSSQAVLNHGTCTTGIVFGKGTGNVQATGMLPQGHAIVGQYNDAAVTSNRYTYTQQLLTPTYEACFQSNSWGSALTTAYNATSLQMDQIVFGLDFPILNSQSNSGTTQSRPQAWAKNIISVGGIKHQNTLSRTDDAWTGGGSIGPAEDGSIKPDISNFYDWIFCTDIVGSSGYSTTNYYDNFGGTSGATPITAGCVGLLTQMFADGVFGVLKNGPTVFARRPHASTVKALLINTATQYPFTGTTSDLTRVHQGWGTADVSRAYNIATAGKVLCIDESAPLTVLQSATYTVNVAAGEPELRVTMVYPDPAGTTSATQHRINNLDLKVTSPTGTIYWGNNGLLANNYSTSGGVANTLDTVENVLLQNPAVGTWTIQVIAAELNQDGNTGTPGIDAKFALVATGGTPPPPGPPDVGQANAADAALSMGGAVNLNSQPAFNGVNGPFFATLAPGSTLALTWSGQPSRPLAIAFGPLNRNNAIFPGVGSLDIGLNGAGNLSDVSIVLDGLNPVTFMDAFANTGPLGSRTVSFTVPAFTPGVVGTFQAAVLTAGLTFKLTAASQLATN